VGLTITSSSLFSQNATTTQEFIKIPVPVVKRIVVDLVKGDSAMAQLTQANLHITELETKSQMQDEMISTFKTVDENNKKIIDGLERKIVILDGEFKTVSKELKKLKVKSKFTNLMSSGVILTLAFFLITK
jgi:uncharacterized coiled-coil protein SlyX